MEEKQPFYVELKGEWDMYGAIVLVMCLCSIYGYVRWHIDGFGGVLGGYCEGRRNLYGRMLLKFCL